MGKLFLGKYERSLDEKGRLLLPSKLIGEEKTSWYILRGFEGCLAIYPEEKFMEAMQRLQELDWNDPANRAYIRLATSSASELKLDSHGRVLLGKEILGDYQIQKDVTIIGSLDHFEIWDTVSFARYQLAHGSQFEALAPRKKA